jgi:hypothetical protein
VSELVDIQPVLRDQVPVVRRFSGGGTVIVDQGTVFVTFICNKNAVAGLQPYPRDIMSWSGQLYGKVFDRFGEFHLRENGMENQSFVICQLNILLLTVSEIPCSNALYPSISFKDRKLWLMFLHLSEHSLLSFV